MKVAADHVVEIEYELRIADGSVVDRSRPGEPLEYLQGHGQIVPGLERELEGMEQGERKDVVVKATDGYGERDPEGVKTLPRKVFPPDAKLRVGQMVTAENEDGDLFQFRVESISDDTVTIDLNHPLAGEELRFSVHVTGVRKATDDELAHGHAHGAHGHDE